jgi:hypothetical protein
MRILLIILSLALGADLDAASDPTPPKSAIFRPSFIIDEGTFSAGTAFVCEYPEGSKQLLLTAHHLFGQGGGMESNLAWNEINDVVRLTVGLAMDDSKTHVICKKALPIPGARALDGNVVSSDIAAFELEFDKNRAAFKLASIAPKVGARVWLFCRQVGRTSAELVPCTVTFSSATLLDYSVEQESFEITATSGAPVIDATGKVVAINIGGRQKGKKVVASGNPAASIRAHIDRAVKR